MSVYTKAGDKGKTKVFDKTSGKLVGVSKRSCKIRSIGAIDELNSFLGVVISFSGDKSLQKRLREIQGDLFTINSILAGSNLTLSKTKVKEIEGEIDSWEGSLPVQKNFIYYGGSQVSSLLFYARALARRAERSLVSFYHRRQSTNHDPLVFMNRLSDFLFILAKKINFDEKVKEEYWMTSKK